MKIYQVLALVILFYGNFSLAEETALVGFANAYIYKGQDNQIVIEFPLQFSGILVNWNKQKFGFMPDRFVLSDGTSLRPFLFVDKSPKSELFKEILSIKKQMILYFKRKKLRTNRENVLRYLAENIQTYIEWEDQPDQKDLIPVSLFNKYAPKVKGLPVGQWLETTEKNPVVGFDQTIKLRKPGVCIDMVLLASFLLESFKVKHRVVFGSNQQNDVIGNGHTWIELEDGRILDVAWNTLAKPQKNKHHFYTDWLWFGNDKGYQYRFAYEFFPIIKLN